MPQPYDSTSNEPLSERISVALPSLSPQQGTPDIYLTMLENTKKAARSSIIEFLTNKRWGKVKDTRYIKKRVGGKMESMPTTTTREDWVDNVKGAKGLMALEYAIEVADYVADQVDVVFSSTYYDPTVNLLNISAIVAMISSQMLDNPRYDFKGNETDSAAFAIKVISAIHGTLNRSTGGFFLKQVGTTTTNIYRRDIKEGDFAHVKDGRLQKLFGGNKQNE